ncbi:antibiotic biosynthesis monooxygenase family protein [Kribbella shirazensis]|uniref:antibiotic biosynthesis monooxygenase family protein n=1 Tax=Kribbella shirazensis TaxID=1105143 RepID=UPI00192D7695|nr:antibiotic biosynthesis monooxygenase [Kribbella shirazensis]
MDRSTASGLVRRVPRRVGEDPRTSPGLTGFHGIERFESSSTEGKYVSLAFFDDEDAVARWRKTPQHRRVQALGRSRLFTQYRLRMAEVTRDYGGRNRDQAPADSRAIHG